MSTILDRIIAETKKDLSDNPRDRERLERSVAGLNSAPYDAFAALSKKGPHVIAEIKRSSPSAGVIKDEVNPVELAQVYAESGASALSVLTEPRHFGGSLDDLTHVSAKVKLPTLRKDFIVDEVQLLEARVHGASMALLIVAALEPQELASLIAYSERLGLLPLVETHSLEEIVCAVDAGARLIGVNNRNLHDFSIDLARSETLRAAIPDGLLAVAESGINTPEDLGRLSRAGYDIFLIGTRLMTSGEPGRTLQAFLKQGTR